MKRKMRIATFVVSCFIIFGAMCVTPVYSFAQGTNTVASKDETLKAPFIIRDRFFRHYGVAWSAASIKQRQDFIKLCEQEQRQRDKEVREWKKSQQESEKARKKAKQLVEKKRREHLRAEANKKRDEDRRRSKVKSRARHAASRVNSIR